MCGRFVMSRSTGDLVAAFGVEESAGGELRPSWNIAPTQPIRMVTERADRQGEILRRLETVRWGLVPVWAKDPKAGARLINARMETVTEKPSFRTAAIKRRGLIPADGYYEWSKNEDGSKTPTYLHPDEGGLIAFAGLYEFWPDPALEDDDENKWLMSATIITTAATDALGHIHDRTPVIVPEVLQADWLNPALNEKPEVRQLLDDMPEPKLTPRTVSPDVGSVRNNGPELIKAV